jgi:uncharacterized protein
MRRFAAEGVRHMSRGAVAAATLLAIALAGAARAAPPLWKVTGPGATVDLFGSIHLLSAAVQWRTPAFDAELARADELWFEIPLGAGSQAEVARLIQARGLLPSGQTLQGTLSPSLWTRVSALAAREGLPDATLQRMKPWLAELELSLLFYQKQGYREDLGVEAQVNAAAPATAKRDAFETPAEQIELFADDPPAEQAASLGETLDEIDADPGIFDRAAQAWRRGDVAALQREVVDRVREEDEALYRRLLVERNRRFAARIEALARSGRGHVFVVVGAGHLVGPDGVPALLRRDGLRVEGP